MHEEAAGDCNPLRPGPISRAAAKPARRSGVEPPLGCTIAPKGICRLPAYHPRP
jgi:hypothetical protein